MQPPSFGLPKTHFHSKDTNVIKIRAGGTAQSGECLLCESQDLVSVSETTLKGGRRAKNASMLASTCNPVTREAEAGGSLGSLVNQPSLPDRFQASERSFLAKQGRQHQSNNLWPPHKHTHMHLHKNMHPLAYTTQKTNKERNKERKQKQKTKPQA